MLDMTEIIDDVLWLGAYPGDELPRKISVVIGVAIEYPPKEYHDNIEGVLWMPISDGQFPGINWLVTIVDYMLRAHALNKMMLVHCVAGISRSPLVVIAYMMRCYHLPYTAAYEYVKARRKVIDPAKIYRCALQEYEKHLGNNAC